MFRGALLVIGVVLAMAPGRAAGQEIGASFRVTASVAQPDLVSNGSVGIGSLAARIPAGWAWSVERGVGGGTSPVTAGRESASLEVAIPAPAEGQLADQVTWMFVPL